MPAIEIRNAVEADTILILSLDDLFVALAKRLPESTG
jgi:hypothetical protein